ncbi:hypothetical protein, partial [Gordonia cholesterolivorans]|uniref:hypothetical protein n=1 Tax=Gordonia cholesterolivorans TaxID=559625 RepID=UPI0031F81AE3
EPRPSTLPDAPTNITLWAARSTDDHNKELALELPGPVIGDLPLENLLDPDAYKRVVVSLINEAAGAERITVADVPDLSDDGTSLWPKIISEWAKANGHSLPGKRVIASRLVEDGLAIPSMQGSVILKTVHEALTRALDGKGVRTEA